MRIVTASVQLGCCILTEFRAKILGEIRLVTEGVVDLTMRYARNWGEFSEDQEAVETFIVG